MAIEKERGCGFRQVGGMYLVGGSLSLPCDRLPMEVGHCPVCGHGVHFTKGIGRINPLKLWGNHAETIGCTCENCCFVCYPPDKTEFIMMVGAQYYPTPEDFMREAREQGISKRIPAVPKELVVGESIVYLAHNKAIEKTIEKWERTKNGQARLIAKEETEYSLGVFTAFIPSRVEKLVWESEKDEVVGDLEKRGITPVFIPDGDKDHE